MTTSVATDHTTICGAFRATADAFADQPALRSMDGTIEWTWREYADRVHEAAAGLAGLGVTRGGTVACWLSNRPEFHVADTAANHLGAAAFSVYPSYTTEQASHVIRDSGARVLIAEASTAERAAAVRAAGGSALETIIVVDDGPSASMMSWAELLRCAPDGFVLDRAVAEVTPSDLATLIYTSGTTGAPKGVELTHANVMAQVATMNRRLQLPGGISAISWLPMAHIAERLCTHYLPIVRGWRVTTCDEPRAIGAVIAETHPEFFFSPPRLWEKLRAALLSRSGGQAPRGDAAARALAQLGFDRLKVAIVGAAPCPREVIQFWHDLGIPLGEVYGMSETTGVATVNPPEAIRIGTCGTPLDGVDVTLSGTGEVLVRGPLVMRGYRNLPDQTAEAIDPDGWLHTGDIGVFDDDGYLRIVDRIKELIISAAGKNMSPANIEATLKAASPAIGHAVCIGDARPFNVALLVPDPDRAAALDPAQLQGEISAAVERANEQLARVEQIKKFHVLAGDWLPGGDELTPTMKLKRKPIATKYAAEIEAMYSG